MQKIFIFLIFLTATLPVFSQNSKVSELMNQGNYQKAQELLTMKQAPSEMDINDLSALGICYIKLKDYNKGETIFREITSRKRARPRHYLYYGEILRINKKYAEAKEAFKIFLKEDPSRDEVHLKIQSCDSLNKWEGYQTDITLTGLDSINSANEEKSALIVNEDFIFISNNIPEKYQEYDRDGKNIIHGYLIQKDSNILFQENLLSDYTCDAMDYSLSKKMFAFTLMKKEKYIHETGVSNSWIYFKKQKDKKDQLIRFKWDNMPKEEINLSHPAFSRQGRRLYFAADIPGGFGGFDLYYSDYKEGKWTTPVNLGDKINTEGDELYPVIAGDSMMYFASDGYPGYGNLDIYQTTMKQDRFSTPKNMKTPVNSIGNDYSYRPVNQWHGYLTSNRSSMSKGMNDVFMYSRPKPVKEPEEVVPPEPEPLVFNPANFVPDPIYFSINSDSIDQAYSGLLTQIADTMKKYEDISLRITGYADHQGPASYSLKLAGKRAKTVSSYLIKQGIDSSRMDTVNGGVNKEKQNKGINYHVQIGSAKKEDVADWYEKAIDHSHKVRSFKNGDYMIYAIGNSQSKAKAETLLDQMKDQHGIEGLIICSSKGKLLANHTYALNRRTEFKWLIKNAQ